MTMLPIPAFQPIGVIRSPYTEPAGVPIQSAVAGDSPGRAEIFEPYVDALGDLDGFERIWLIYAFHRCGPARLRVTPFRDTIERGLFSTRAPCRPNPIGLSPVRLLRVDGNVLELDGVDILDGTPLLDIKPYAPQFDAFPSSRAGWLDRGTDRNHADERFEK